MTKAIKWIGNSRYGDRDVSIYKIEEGGYALVGHDSPCEDWVLARADIGIAARRREGLEALARQAAIVEGCLHVETLGLEGFSNEAIARHTDVWRGPPRFSVGDHRFRVEKRWDSMPIVGRGEVSYAEVSFRLLPTAIRLGTVVVYDE